MKGINNFSGTILILGIFLFDSLLGSVTLLMGQAETVEEWVGQVNDFMGFRSLFTWIPYMLILFLIKNRIYISKEDEALVLLCLMMSMVDSIDYFVNANWRPVWMDWTVFSIVSVSLIIHKVKRLRN